MAIKDDYIKIRVSKEQKALFKDIAKKKEMSKGKKAICIVLSIRTIVFMPFKLIE